MTVRVLVVDDSGFFRHRISEFLHSDRRLEVVGIACDGVEAIEKCKALKPDVITMDIEMPRMNGIDAVRVVMRESPTQILMLSALTKEGARATLKALEAGAADYMPKDMREWLAHKDEMQSLFCEKVLELAQERRFRLGRKKTFNTVGKAPTPVSTANSSNHVHLNPSQFSRHGLPKLPACKMIVIGASTGGPAALQALLVGIPPNFPYPILLVQHMPKAFTQVFAQRLNQLSQLSVKEAEDGDILKPGHAYLAPGGKQMMVDGRNSRMLKVIDGGDRVAFKPSVDITYGSVAKAYGRSALAIILTGMGADGTDGARLLKQAGAKVWAQDEESCTIFGMPKSVIESGSADAVLSLDQLVSVLSRSEVARS